MTHWGATRSPPRFSLPNSQRLSWHLCVTAHFCFRAATDWIQHNPLLCSYGDGGFVFSSGTPRDSLFVTMIYFFPKTQPFLSWPYSVFLYFKKNKKIFFYFN
jgi:hypothetical protein